MNESPLERIRLDPSSGKHCIAAGPRMGRIVESESRDEAQFIRIRQTESISQRESAMLEQALGKRRELDISANAYEAPPTYKEGRPGRLIEFPIQFYQITG